MFNSPYYRQLFSSLLQQQHPGPHTWRGTGGSVVPPLAFAPGAAQVPLTPLWINESLDAITRFLSSAQALFKLRDTGNSVCSDDLL